MPVEIPDTPNAPPAAGPYSPAVRAGDWVVLAGQGGFDPGSGQIVEGVEAQTRQTLENIRRVLGDCDCSLADVAKTTVFLADMDDFSVMNAVYAEVLGGHKPARTTVEAARLPLDLRVEIEVWAYRPRP